jgi:hypothetical protein
MRDTTNQSDGDDALNALDLLERALIQGAVVDRAILDRVRHIREQRKKGLAYSEIVPAEPRPLIVEMLSENLDRLATAGNRFRRTEAQALHDDGLTMDEIATLFGVSRQRISTLLRHRDEESES